MKRPPPPFPDYAIASMSSFSWSASTGASVELHGFQAEVAPVRDLPLVILLLEQRADQPNERCSVGEDPDHLRSPLHPSNAGIVKRLVTVRAATGWLMRGPHPERRVVMPETGVREIPN